MKRITVVMAAILSVVLTFAACDKQKPVVVTPDPTKSGTEGTQTTNPSAHILPEYEPGSIKLEDQRYDDYEFERKYRIAYYQIWGEFFALLDNDQMDDFHQWQGSYSKEINYGESQNEMLLVTVVKRYDIPKDAFEQAVINFTANKKLDQYDIIPEELEPPNADIIYTFDNEIINNYYRYE